MFKDIVIENQTIGNNHPPYIIAEMSGNHNQSLERAIKIVEAAAEAGAHAIKLQTYTADTMTLDLKDGPFLIDDPNSLWNGETLYDLYKKAHTPWEWHQPIFDRCRELGIAAFSTPFDESAVEFLESLNVPAYKIASFENTDLPLIKKVAAMGKSMLISTGMATIAEMREKASMTFRRSLYIANDIRKGEKLSKDNLRIIRPGFGLPPKYYEIVLGKTINKDLKKGTPLRWDLLG